MTTWIIKCRDCQFMTNDLMEVYEHIKTLGHENYSLIEGGTVKIDWLQIKMNLIRGEPTI